jgi:putative SOS response-associated peptidase YedK
VPANGFYEWQSHSARKQAYKIAGPQRSPDRFGLWATWTPEHGESIETFDIVTTAASRLVAEMHDRMPVIVAPADYQLWPTAS